MKGPMKQALLEMFGTTSNDLSPQAILTRLAAASIIAGFIFLSYWLSHEGSIYSKKFNVSLVVLTVMTTTVMIVIGNNLAMSLGMVGALSIVRFRTAIKEPLDIAFLFWSIAVGIVLAAGLIPLAVFGSMVIGFMLLVFVNRKSRCDPYIAVLQCDGRESETRAADFLRQNTRRCVVKSKTVQKDAVELNLEIRLKDGNTGFINALADLPGVRSAVLVSYNGDYMG